MRVIVDAYGGDNAPFEVVKGALQARDAYGVDIILAATGFWFLVSEHWLGRVRPFMTTTFFIYALHFIPTRLMNKVGAILLPGNAAVAWILFFSMPVVIVILCNQAARILRKFMPKLWMLLNGAR